jgi:hypothetical protein
MYNTMLFVKFKNDCAGFESSYYKSLHVTFSGEIVFYCLLCDHLPAHGINRCQLFLILKIPIFSPVSLSTK